MNQAKISPAGIGPAKISAERWRQIKSLLESALDLNVEDRSAFLDKNCGEDKALRSEVESLLEASEQAGDFMKNPAIEEAAKMLAENYASKTRWASGDPRIVSNPVSKLAPGATLDGRYTIEGALGGDSGMGEVFLARNLKLPGAQVAIKVLRAQIMESEERGWFEKKFRAEIEALTRINHPGVVHAIDAGQLPDGRPYFVMQYVPGRTLRTVMSPGGMELRRVADLLRKIAPPLDAAHEQGIIHRDLKPANIMLQFTSGEEYVKIIDFGIATVVGLTSGMESKRTKAIGTLPYMAPEQFEGRPATASDIFALGVIVFEMLTGQLPFNGSSTGHQIELQRAGVEEKLRSLRADIPEAARDAILKAICFDVSNRYKTARQFSEGFDRALTISKQPDTFITNTFAPPEPRPTLRRWPAWATILIVLTALIGAVATGFIIVLPRLPQARNGTAVNDGVKAQASLEHVLSYQLEAQRNPERYPASKTFIPPRDSFFKAGDQVRLRVSGMNSGFIYVINEGPEKVSGLPDYTVLFPHEGQSAQVAAQGKIDLDWFVFDKDRGVEKIWLIWSERMVAELEPLKKWMNKRDFGRVSDSGERIALANYLKALAKAKVEADEPNKLTIFKSSAEVLAGVVKLDHR